MVIEELNLRKHTVSRGRRHSFLHPLDVRDFMEPDKYHRYEEIFRYLKVKKIFLSVTNSFFRTFLPDIHSWSFLISAGATRTGASWQSRLDGAGWERKPRLVFLTGGCTGGSSSARPQLSMVRPTPDLRPLTSDL